MKAGRRKTIEQLFQDYQDLCSPFFIERRSERAYLEGLRHVGLKINDEPAPKSQEQLKLEKWLERRMGLLQRLKERIMRRLKIEDPAIKAEKFSGFSLFLLVNFQVRGNDVRKRFAELVMPEKITSEMIREATMEKKI